MGDKWLNASMKSLTRRSFIRWAITSGAALACPFPLPAAEPATATSAKRPRRLTSEAAEICHKIRDSTAFPLPAPSRAVDVVIVGAGLAGMAVAHALAGADFLMLEKEPRIGGNACAETWNGLSYCTGSAWMSFFDQRITDLFKKWKLEPLPIKGRDAGCFEGKWIRDFWDGRVDSPRIEELPYNDGVKKGFREFLSEIGKIDLVKQKAKLDAVPFSNFLRGKPQPLIGYWDQFGLSNWGADTANSSAFLGVEAASDWPRDTRFTFEGGLGVVPQRIFDGFPEEMQRRFLLEAPVYQVRRQGKRALVYFFKDGQPTCLEAKAVIFCAPKLIASRVVSGLPVKQRQAMAAMRYAPYPVYNLCFTKRVADLGYDSYIVGAKHMSDVVQADWVTRGRAVAADQPQVLTVYAPMRESERAELLDDDRTLARAERAVAEVLAALPGASEHLAEVRIFRRAHAMPMSTPGCYTKLQPLLRADLPPIYFAHSDQIGEVSDLSFAMLAGIEAVKKAVKHL